MDRDRAGGHDLREFISPFNEADTGVHVLVETEIQHRIRAVQAVKIEMGHRNPAVVFVHEGEGGTRNRFADAEPRADPLYETGLPRAEIAGHPHRVPRLQPRGQAPSDPRRLPGTVRAETALNRTGRRVRMNRIAHRISFNPPM